MGTVAGSGWIIYVGSSTSQLEIQMTIKVLLADDEANALSVRKASLEIEGRFGFAGCRSELLGCLAARRT